MRQQWILRFALLTQLAAGGILFTFEAVRMKDMGLGEATIGLILASGSAVFIFSSLFWGRLADRHRCHKRIVVYGTVGLAALMLYFSFCSSALQFLIYAIARAILIPMIMGIMPVLAVSAIGKNKQGSQFGNYRAFGSLGFIVGTMILPLVFNDLGLAAQAAALILLSSLVVLRKLPEPGKDSAASVPLRLRKLDPLISLFLLSFFFIAVAEPALAGFFFAYARELEGSTRLLGLLSGAMGLVAFVSLPIMGRFVDRASPWLILVIAFLAQSLRVFCTSLVLDPNYLWIPLLLHGITWGGVEVSAVLYLASLVKEDQKATVLSFYMAIRMLGHLTGSGLSGYLAETLGYTTMFHVIAAIALLGALIFVIGGWLLGRRE